MKKNQFFTLILVMFFSISVIFIPGCSKGEKEQAKKAEAQIIKVGAILPLTGKMAFYGNEVKMALTIAKMKYSEKKIEFVFEDSQSIAANSITIFNKFSQDKNINLIISCNSPLSIPLRPLAEKYKKVLLALVTGARDFGAFNIWSFRDAINQDQEGVALAKYIFKEKGMKKGVTFVVNDDYGLGGAESFAKKGTELGGTIINQETFEMNDRNMRTKILKLLEGKPEFIFLVGREQTIISSINQIRELNTEIPIITSDAFDSVNVINGLGDNAKGVVFASYYNNLENEEAKYLVSQFKKLYNKEPGIYAIDAYVAGNYIIENLLFKKMTGEEMRELFSKMTYSSPIKGKLSVDEKRNVISPVAIYTLDDNKEKKLLNVVE